MKTATEILIQEQAKEYMRGVKLLLKQPYIHISNGGFVVDVIKLIDSLKKKERNDIVKHIISNYGYEN